MIHSRIRALFSTAAVLLCATASVWAQPGDVTDLSVSGTTPHRLTLSWTAYAGEDFVRYEVRKGAVAGVTVSDELVASITTSETTTLTDSNLVAYMSGYYRVFVIDTAEAASAGVEISTRTAALYYPHVNTVDSSADLAFAPAGRWAVVENSPGEGDANTGTYHWSDSPGGNYDPSTNAALTMTINLGTSLMPVLTYWDRYAFESQVDFGYIEVSLDGSTWEQAGFVTGSQTTWQKKELDLTQWAGYGEVRVRFRSTSGSSVESDGWHLDDFSIDEPATTSLPYPFVENFEEGAGNWLTSRWGITSNGHSLPNTITDSPLTNYSRDSRNVMVSEGVFDLSTATNPVLTFWHKYVFFTDHSYYNHNEDDYGRVYVSDDYGRPGSYVQVASFGGTQNDWTRVVVDLSQFAGKSDVRVMFKIIDRYDLNYTSTNRQRDGWYLDDIRLEELPAMVNLHDIEASSSSMHHAVLAWDANTDDDFAYYEIRRSTSESVTRSSTLVATIDNQTTTSYTDSVAMIQPTVYYYRMYAIDDLGNASPGSVIQQMSYTVPQNTFPFTDDMSATTENWAWGTPWGATTATYHSSPACWTDSPGASYANNVNTALATVVDLSGSAEPVLVFWTRYDMELNADYGRVEISNDGGTTWTPIWTVTGTDTTWQEERISLHDWIGQTVGLRFRLQSNSEISHDGWYVDDVSITNSSRVVSYPFFDDVEGETSWFAQSPWGTEDSESYSGTSHWSDSPAGNYADNVSTALSLTINLSDADMPILTYQERYAFQTNADWGFLEISTDGTNWTQYCAVTGVQSEWGERRIDLTPFAGGSQVHLRFRVDSDGSSTADGWHIDDIAIDETSVTAMSYPFVDEFDSTNVVNWIASGWKVVAGGTSTPYTITDSPLGNYSPGSTSGLITAGVLDLTGIEHPVLTFWHKYAFYTDHSYYNHNEDDYGRVYVSDDAGHSGTWTQIAAYGGTNTTWTKVQLDLTQFAGQQRVRVMFRINDREDLNYPGTNRQADGWYLDDIRIENQPQAVTISPITSSSLHHVDLEWSQNPDDDFNRYEIYRSTSTAVSRTSTLVATITDQATTSWTDVVTLIQPGQYSYRMYVYDNLETVSLGSNVVTATYTVPENSFPFKDSLNADGAAWNWSAPWGPVTTTYHSEPSAWKSDPVQAYKANENSALTTTVNLAGATAPVLEFWHRYALQAGIDFGNVEVSKDGGATWTRVLRVTGVDTTWNAERIDLGAYTGETISLRFRLTSDSETQLDGWYIDDVSIINGSRDVAFPWWDNMESGQGSWFADSPWGLSDVGSHSGQWHWTDSPAGNYAPNESAALKITMNLSGASAPAMRFWQRYSLGPNADWGFIEISTDGGSSWTQRYAITGSQSTWMEDEVDLSNYAGNSEVMVRFRVQSNASGQSDGWHIDDIEIVEIAHEFAYPFTDDFDDSTTADKWITGSWDRMSGGRSGPYMMHDSRMGNYPRDSQTEMTMAGTIDLRGAEQPVLTFWHKRVFYTDHSYYNHNEDDYGRVYVSPDNGSIWYLKGSYGGSSTSWTKTTIDLSEYIGAAEVKVRFRINDREDLNYPGTNRQADGWWLDDVRIGEDLTAVALPDLVQLEGPEQISSAPGMASPRLIGVVKEPGVTDVTGAGVGVLAQFGVGAEGSMPTDTTWTWFTGGYLNDADGADRFFGSVTVDTAGVYSVGFRASIDGGETWIYGDLDGNDLAGGGLSEFEAENAGLLIVGLGADLDIRPEYVEQTLRQNEQGIWAFHLVNHGPDPLSWQVFEATGDSVVSDVAWIVLQTDHGFIHPDKTVPLSFTLDATDLAFDSTYTAMLLFTSNSTDEDSLWVPIAFTVLEEGVPGFTGRVVIRHGAAAVDGSIVLYDETDAAVDTLPIGPSGWFADYGVIEGTYSAYFTAPGAYPMMIHDIELPAEGRLFELSSVHQHAVSPFFSTLYSETSTLDGDPLPEGAVITARAPDGAVCGAIVVTTAGSYGPLHVYADDASTTEDEGVTIGDTLTLYVNDMPTDTKVEYENHNAMTPANITATSIAPLALEAGLHLISVPVMPSDTSLTTVLNTIAGKYSYVAGFDPAWGGARTYVDSLPQFSDLDMIDGFHGYWIRMDEAGDLIVPGTRVFDDVPMDLLQGWNLVSYLPTTELAPERAFAGILDEVRVVGGFNGGAETFVPGESFNDLDAMQYGCGYWVYLHNPARHVYRAMPLSEDAQLPARMARTAEDPVIPTSQWMDIYGSITLEGLAVAESTIVSLADGDGVICGQTYVMPDGTYGFLHIYGDDPATDLDEGADQGEALRVLVNGTPALGAPRVVWASSKNVTRVNLALRVLPTDIDASRAWEFSLGSARPNPFNPTTAISYEIAESGVVRLIVYNHLGQQVRTLVHEMRAPGHYDVVWNGRDDLGRDSASGVYLIRLIAQEGTLTTRAVLAR